LLSYLIVVIVALQRMPTPGGQKTDGWLGRKDLRKFCRKSKVWLLLLRLAGAKVTDHMVDISEELRAAKAAKAAIDFLLTATPKAMVVATVNKAKYAAVLNLSSGGGALNEARTSVGIALSNVIHGMPTQEKIDNAKRVIEAWIRELEASPAA
jgi:hypothetical protein